jgi:Protein of unknown function (DUF3040)
MVSIRPHEQEILDLIERDLAISGPKLASMLATFGRLTAGEDMPVRERIWRTAGVPSATPPGDVGLNAGQASARQIPAWFTARAMWRWLWLVLAFAVMAAALAFDHGGGRSICAVSRTAACAQMPGHAPTPPSSAVAVRGR